MNESSRVRIEVEAAQALAKWKSRFAQLVNDRAKSIASQSGVSDVVTLEDYKQAAQAVWAELSETISLTQPSHGQKRAA